MTEEWKAIAGREAFMVSNLGRVLGPTGDLKNLTKHTKGYLCVSIKGREYLVHRLVAAAFLGPGPPKHCVNHKNARKDDNRVENLEYITQKQNVRLAVEMGLKAGALPTSLTAEQIAEIKRIYVAPSDLAKRYGVSTKTILDLFRTRSSPRYIPRQPRKRVCEVCVAEFVSKTRRARFCSIACRQKAYAARKENAAPDALVAPSPDSVSRCA